MALGFGKQRARARKKNKRIRQRNNIDTANEKNKVEFKLGRDAYMNNEEYNPNRSEHWLRGWNYARECSV